MRLLPALLLLAACAAPASGPGDTPDGALLDTPFDAEAWMAAVEIAESPREQITLTEALLDAVDWRTACGEDDPTAPGRGTLALAHIGATQSLAAVTCQQFAYQSTFALVDARAGKPPRLVRSLVVSEDGMPTEETADSYFGVLSHDSERAPDRFDVFTKGAGHGGCGQEVRYRLLPDSGAAIERVRHYDDCRVPLARDAWPVTYEG